jgi:predicted DNA-binding protein with PD1-like motif
MKARLIHESDGARTFAVVLDKGDEVIETMTGFATEQKLAASRVTGIGAFSDATLAMFRRDLKDYQEIPVDEDVEVVSLLGDIALRDGEPFVHLHAGLGRADGSTVSGHLLAGRVWPTLEVMVTDAPTSLVRTFDEESGLALIDPSAT